LLPINLFALLEPFPASMSTEEEINMEGQRVIFNRLKDWTGEIS